MNLYEYITKNVYTFCKQRREVTPNSGAGQFKAILPFNQMFSKSIARLFNFSTFLFHLFSRRGDPREERLTLETRGLAKLSRRRRWPNQRGSTTVKRNDPTLRSGKEKRTRKTVPRCELGKSGVRLKTFLKLGA